MSLHGLIARLRPGASERTSVGTRAEVGGASWPWPHVDWGELLIIELCVLIGLVLLYVAGQILHAFNHFLLLIAAASAIALFVAPGVLQLERRIGSRVAATAIVYTGVLLAVTVSLVLIAFPLVREATGFASELPRHIERLPELASNLEAFADERGIPLHLTELAGRATSQIQEGGTAVLTGTVGVATAVTGTLADVALALVLSFYLSIDGPRLRDKAMQRLSPTYLPRALRFEASIRRVFGGYLRGQMILAVVLGLLAGGGAVVLGLPYPVVIGVLAGVFELVPMFGSMLGAVPAIVVALFQPFPTVLWVVLVFFVINQAESYLLAPRITGESLGLSPFFTLAALLLGIELAGFLGALVAVPIAALLVDQIEQPRADPIKVKKQDETEGGACCNNDRLRTLSRVAGVQVGLSPGRSSSVSIRWRTGAGSSPGGYPADQGQP
ncbi:MAG: hypothetical protein HW416_2857 [Chloroflexi bacterium]|nr:hypothetical protein [Chloroflexota bacterium]